MASLTCSPYGDADRATSRRRLTAQLVDPRSAADGALVPRNGGFGAFGSGNEVIRARNPGEARNANKATRNFLEVKRAEAQRTRVAIKVHNSQKHLCVSIGSCACANACEKAVIHYCSETVHAVVLAVPIVAIDSTCARSHPCRLAASVQIVFALATYVQ